MEQNMLMAITKTKCKKTKIDAWCKSNIPRGVLYNYNHNKKKGKKIKSTLSYDDYTERDIKISGPGGDYISSWGSL